MSEPFGSIITEPTPLGEVAGPKTCYHIFIVYMFVVDTPGGGWSVYDSTGGYINFNISKSCQCMSAWAMAGLKFKLRGQGLSGGITSSPSTGTTPGTVYSGYEVEEKGKCPPKRCRCEETINLAGMSSKDGSWTDSTGTKHSFNSTNPADVMKDIIDTEKGLPCDCS